MAWLIVASCSWLEPRHLKGSAFTSGLPSMCTVPPSSAAIFVCLPGRTVRSACLDVKALAALHLPDFLALAL